MSKKKKAEQDALEMVELILEEGYSLEEIEATYPHLLEAVEEVRGRATDPEVARPAGATASRTEAKVIDTSKL